MFNGAILIGAKERTGAAAFHAVNPATGEAGDVGFGEADADGVAAACALAAQAFDHFSTIEPEARATFLERIADAITAIGDDLVTTAHTETALPRARLEGETGRTTGQLRMFAEELRRGLWLDVTIDPAMPERAPLPRADLRRMNVPLGPVAVFGASNFPLAFSVAGGDTAAAFAAGCPVVVKGHPAHPGTGELVARAIRAAVAECGLPEGVFSYLPGPAQSLGAALVADPRIKAVGFTGSRAGGLALVRIATERPEPIPVFAEMSSINPVVLLPGALAARATALGAAFVQSLTLGAGQFCTNPGLVIAIDGPDLDGFLAAAAEALAQNAAATMLTPGIHAVFERDIAELSACPELERIAVGGESDGPNRAVGTLFSVEASAFIANPRLAQETFGPAAIVVRCRDLDELLAVIGELEGQLTATVQLDAADHAVATKVLPALQAKVGRLLCNGWPTGVEVTHAMVHGGPYPATSDGRSTSVGTLAMMRFLRPVCFQDIPDALLPPPLQAANPWSIPRRVNGAGEVLP